MFAGSLMLGQVEAANLRSRAEQNSWWIMVARMQNSRMRGQGMGPSSNVKVRTQLSPFHWIPLPEGSPNTATCS